MPQSYGSRIAIVLAVLYVGLLGFFPFTGRAGIFDGYKIFKSQYGWAEKTNLKPGIDIAGGISLTYEIKVPSQGVPPGTNLAEQVAKALKLRVDPVGVKNLIWRPQGDTRLEIQLPRSTGSDKIGAIRQAYLKAQDEVDQLNERADAVISAAQSPAGAERDKRLEDMASDSADRLQSYKKLAGAFDQLHAAQKEADDATRTNDAKLKDKADNDYAQANVLIHQIETDGSLEKGNLSAADLTSILDNPNSGDRDKKISEIRADNAHFPARLKSIDDFVASYTQYKNLHGAIDDSAELKSLLRGSGVLEFHILVDNTYPASDIQSMIQRLKTSGPAPEGGDTMRWYPADKPDEFKRSEAGFPQDYNGKKYVLVSIAPKDSMIHDQKLEPWALTSARVERNQAQQQCVGFEFDAQGAKLFGDLTGSHLPAGGSPTDHHYALAIVLDNKLISAPNLNGAISKNGIIEGGGGGFTPAELSYLVNTLSAGSLPAQLEDDPISERVISPTLGVENLRLGLMASFIGLAVVAVFLIGYYYIAGIVAFFAVVMNLVVILGILALFGATFTLPSIAGIVLTVGTAVDANVLVFERLREEQHRGLSLKMALSNAYAKALHAIVDSNMTTVLTSLFLYILGTEEVKGFGLTLLIGICSSLFTALFVTKTIFGIMIKRFGLKDLRSLPQTFPKWDKLLRPNIDWMGLIWPFIIFSTIFISAGMFAFIRNSRNMFDIEFASGTEVQFDLKKTGADGRKIEPMTISEIIKLIEQENAKWPADKQPIPAANIVSLGNDPYSFELVTQNEKVIPVRDAIMSALGSRLEITLPSTFDNYIRKDANNKELNSNAAALIGTTIRPVPKDPLVIDGVLLPDAAAHKGGVAIVLRNLSPALSPNEIKSRISLASVEPEFEGKTKGLEDIDVDRLDSLTGRAAADKPCTSVVILASDPHFSYNQNVADWTQNLAQPLWNLVNNGVDKPARLQKVSNFNPQVAATAQADAIVATTLSILAIMAYIWFRFGNLKYGTATVVALIHDTLATIGAIGLSHIVSKPIAHALLLEPFRINLTLVAAILTVMSYSMIDTIVVFDRIREIRGKYGRITRSVINDGINQTLSRTLLTCGITIIMVATMYICGGAGIHGFTFVLLVGILVGTYSSIAIAAPILLVGSGNVSAQRPGSGATIQAKPALGNTRKVGMLNQAG